MPALEPVGHLGGGGDRLTDGNRRPPISLCPLLQRSQVLGFASEEACLLSLVYFYWLKNVSRSVGLAVTAKVPGMIVQRKVSSA